MKWLAACVLTMVFGCNISWGSNEHLDEFILQDIATVQSRHMSQVEQAEVFEAFRRLESLTRGRVDLDSISYIFYNDLLKEDTLSSYTQFWINWVIINRGRLTVNAVKEAVDQANAAIYVSFPEQLDIVKLRIKNGIDAGDSTKDQSLRDQYLEMMEELKIDYPISSP